jgi:hypothetical protein
MSDNTPHRKPKPEQQRMNSPASLDFPYFIATSVFSNVYFLWYDSLGLSNNNVDIVFSAHGAFLEFL